MIETTSAHGARDGSSLYVDAADGQVLPLRLRAQSARSRLPADLLLGLLHPMRVNTIKGKLSHLYTQQNKQIFHLDGSSFCIHKLFRVFLSCYAHTYTHNQSFIRSSQPPLFLLLNSTLFSLAYSLCFSTRQTSIDLLLFLSAQYFYFAHTNTVSAPRPTETKTFIVLPCFVLLLYFFNCRVYFLYIFFATPIVYQHNKL